MGRDPEVRATSNGGSIATLSVATSESWTDKRSGERTERHRVTILNNDNLCKLVERYLTKGSKVFVEGQIRTRKWADNDGIERYGTEIRVTPYGGAITFLDGRSRCTTAPQWVDVGKASQPRPDLAKALRRQVSPASF